MSGGLKFTRVGGRREIGADFRVIAATSRDIEAAVEEGGFDKDLYYILNVFSIELPPLVGRKGDIPLLANHFLGVAAAGMNKKVDGISRAAMDLLVNHDWPGNVRELQNAVERAAVVCKDGAIQPSHVPVAASDSNCARAGRSLAEVERDYIKRVLDQLDWKISRAARVLQVDRVTIYNKIKKYDLRRA